MSAPLWRDLEAAFDSVQDNGSYDFNEAFTVCTNVLAKGLGTPILAMYWPNWQCLPMTRTPLATNRIHESLDAALARKRVVLWYDANGEWETEFESYEPSNAEKPCSPPSSNGFTTKALTKQAMPLTMKSTALINPNKL
jgi:hypothetical protein